MVDLDRWLLRPGPQRVVADALFSGWRWASRMGTAGAGTRHAARFQHVGAGAAFSWPPGPTMGERWVRVGDAALVGPEVALSVGMWPDEDLRPADGWVIRIGDRVNLGRRCALVGRCRIDIGADVTFAPGVYVTDHNHRYADHSTPIARQWVDEAPVRIGAGTWLGTGAVVLPGTDIGANVVVAAHAVVRGGVPDRCVIAGSPARVVRRWDAAAGAWDPPLKEGEGDAEAPPGWDGG
ncbi:MAG: acyltransferase [Acidimicrobiia bacterium]|nr:acyltransferase [Acidimicrobiia bacterium]